MRLVFAWRRICIAFLLCLWPAFGFAQNVSLEGRVMDSLGGTINGAVVTVSSPQVTTPRTTRTGVDGTFSFDAVPAGTLNLQVEAPGFERHSLSVALTSAGSAQSAGCVRRIAAAVRKLRG